MKHHLLNSVHPETRRKLAEQKLRQLTARQIDELSAAASRRLIHELQVHQIELEMQNEELRTTHEALEQSRSKYASLFDFAPVGYATLDPEGLITEANLTFSTMIGRDRGSLMNKPFNVLLGGQSRKTFSCHIMAVFASEKHQTCEIKLRRKDGTELDVQLESIASLDEDGKKRCRTSAVDITDGMGVRKKLEQTMKQLSQSNLELEHFAAAASHDLKQPLLSISGLANLLAKNYKGSLGKDADEYIDFIVSSTIRMDQLIDDMLTYSRVTSGQRDISPVDMNACFIRALSDLTVIIEESGAKVIADPLPTLKANTIQMEQLLKNLLANGLKFHGKNPPRVRLSSRKTGGCWLFSITDNGIGIAEKDRQRIFGMCQRLHPSSRFPGTGIGLTLCKKIVDQHRGRIWIESEEGKGSTFYFTLPA